jgi:cobalamin biosynthesis Mg chelatase CobN
MLFLVIFLFILVGILSYTTYINYKKVEKYEEYINMFYSRVSIVLATMRAIDERKIFESDDEVGDVFQQLVDTLGELRPLLYGEADAEEED